MGGRVRQLRTPGVDSRFHTAHRSGDKREGMDGRDSSGLSSWPGGVPRARALFQESNR